MGQEIASLFLLTLFTDACDLSLPLIQEEKEVKRLVGELKSMHGGETCWAACSVAISAANLNCRFEHSRNHRHRESGLNLASSFPILRVCRMKGAALEGFFLVAGLQSQIRATCSLLPPGPSWNAPWAALGCHLTNCVDWNCRGADVHGIALNHRRMGAYR